MKRVILSTKLLLEVGTFEMKEVSLEEARAFAKDAENFCGHATVKVLGIEPALGRHSCKVYDQCLVVDPVERLEFGREYSLEEILAIGVKAYLIEKVA